MYNIPGLAGEPSIHDELAVAGTGRDVVLMATGVKFSDRAMPPH
jgi:hypothetical protein